MPTALETLRRQYFALVPPYLLRVPAPAELSSADAQAFLVAHLLESALPAPDAGYQRTFWRRVLPVLEDGVAQDADDEAIYEAIAELMAAPASAGSAPPASHKTFIYDDSGGAEQAVTLLEEQVVVQAGTTGLRTWTAALFLAHYVLSGAVGVGSAAVELGAGTGFLAAVLAQRGCDVIATDLGDNDDEEQEGEEEEGQRRTPLRRLAANLALNDLAAPARAAALDWSDAALAPADRPAIWAEALAPVDGQRRTVVAADVVRAPGAIDVLISPADGDGAPPPVAIIAATVRNEDTFALFLAECAKRHLSTQLLDLAPIDDAPTFWDTALDRGTRVQVVRISKQ
ncbi:hypothetical protein VHUM_03342 [Vanrija humicola]|uniref:FAM86 N-terminal domain-containing protein n=1 Tax=Vanrija humicola TaxID=5417 RepID=A0A7D8V3L0_VANHU|nr:hypothetical protein VHUM_03342 [Vanrija humicola]